MRIDQVRAMSTERLKEEEGNLQKELLNLRFKLATRQLGNSKELREAKHTLARVKTVMRERELMGAER